MKAINRCWLLMFISLVTGFGEPFYQFNDKFIVTNPPILWSYRPSFVPFELSIDMRAIAEETKVDLSALYGLDFLVISLQALNLPIDLKKAVINGISADIGIYSEQNSASNFFHIPMGKILELIKDPVETLVFKFIDDFSEFVLSGNKLFILVEMFDFESTIVIFKEIQNSPFFASLHRVMADSNKGYDESCVFFEFEGVEKMMIPKSSLLKIDSPDYYDYGQISSPSMIKYFDTNKCDAYLFNKRADKCRFEGESLILEGLIDDENQQLFPIRKELGMHLCGVLLPPPYHKYSFEAKFITVTEMDQNGEKKLITEISMNNFMIDGIGKMDIDLQITNFSPFIENEEIEVILKLSKTTKAIVCDNIVIELDSNVFLGSQAGTIEVLSVGQLIKNYVHNKNKRLIDIHIENDCLRFDQGMELKIKGFKLSESNKSESIQISLKNNNDLLISDPLSFSFEVTKPLVGDFNFSLVNSTLGSLTNAHFYILIPKCGCDSVDLILHIEGGIINNKVGEGIKINKKYNLIQIENAKNTIVIKEITLLNESINGTYIEILVDSLFEEPLSKEVYTAQIDVINRTKEVLLRSEATQMVDKANISMNEPEIELLTDQRITIKFTLSVPSIDIPYNIKVLLGKEIPLDKNKKPIINGRQQRYSDEAGKTIINLKDQISTIDDSNQLQFVIEVTSLKAKVVRESTLEVVLTTENIGIISNGLSRDLIIANCPLECKSCATSIFGNILCHTCKNNNLVVGSDGKTCVKPSDDENTEKQPEDREKEKIQSMLNLSAKEICQKIIISLFLYGLVIIVVIIVALLFLIDYSFNRPSIILFLLGTSFSIESFLLVIINSISIGFYGVFLVGLFSSFWLSNFIFVLIISYSFKKDKYPCLKIFRVSHSESIGLLIYVPLGFSLFIYKKIKTLTQRELIRIKPLKIESFNYYSLILVIGLFIQMMLIFLPFVVLLYIDTAIPLEITIIYNVHFALLIISLIYYLIKERHCFDYKNTDFSHKKLEDENIGFMSQQEADGIDVSDNPILNRLKHFNLNRENSD